eukprot:6274970-Prymnesium_polylepis.1
MASRWLETGYAGPPLAMVRRKAVSSGTWYFSESLFYMLPDTQEGTVPHRSGQTGTYPLVGG